MAKDAPFLFLTEEWQTIQKVKLLAVEQDLLTKKGTHSVCWVQFLQIFTSICDAPNVKTGNSRNSCQIDHSEVFGFCVTNVLNKNVHVKQWILHEAKDLHQRCVPEKVWPTETRWRHIEACQIWHVLQSCLWECGQTRVTHLCVPVCDFFDFVTELPHEKKGLIVEHSVVTQKYLLPNQLVTDECFEKLVRLWEVQQGAWVQMSCDFNNDVTGHGQQLQCKQLSKCGCTFGKLVFIAMHISAVVTISVFLPHGIHFLSTCTHHLNLNTTQRVNEQPIFSHVMHSHSHKAAKLCVPLPIDLWVASCTCYSLSELLVQLCPAMLHVVHHWSKSSNQPKWVKSMEPHDDVYSQRPWGMPAHDLTGSSCRSVSCSVIPMWMGPLHREQKMPAMMEHCFLLEPCHQVLLPKTKSSAVVSWADLLHRGDT